ncbi:MAG: carboxypeptidase-like regulatory domain-containing protein [Cyclobacteriaceae bacterium]|nr:carboxypeptidase-like regulatory domain-containing protein [Cyclobacteriaceae bacterium]
MKLKNALFLICLLCVSCAWAQEKRVITGKVTDKISGEVLPSVNVFLANTSIGASTGADGSFRLQNIPEGKYDLIASSVGYKPYFLPVDLSNTGNGFTQEIKLNIQLEAEVKELSEITVKADTTNWTRNYNDFVRLFLGETRLSKNCKISNPKVLHFYMDTRDQVLVAHSKKPLEIINSTRGYKITYYLYQFEYNLRSGTLMIFGVPLFEELPTTKERIVKKRQQERKKAYEGSVVHFMRSLHRNQLKENGFEMRKMFLVKNRKRLPDEVINRNIRRLSGSGKQIVINLSSSPTDSLSYYFRMRSEPKEVDSIAAPLLSGQEYWNPNTQLFEGIQGRFHIIFDANEEIEYLRVARRTQIAKQQSQFNFIHPTLKVYPNGYYEDVRTLFLFGYLSWHEKIATLLPSDYEPPID